MKPSVYLDYAATTPPRAEVVEAMQPFLMEVYGNPSSLYRPGRETRKALEGAREQIASLIHAETPADIVFTSGGTESNNMTLKGLAFGLNQKGRHLVTSEVEHPSILEPCAWLESMGWQVTYLPVDTRGFVNPADLKAAIRKDTVLISLMHGNNEVGTLQPIADFARIAQDSGVLFHTDAVQTVGKLPIDVKALGVNLLSCSGHKLYGPKGVGFLYANEKARAVMAPLLHGGGQQSNLRSGTENLAGIIGMTHALKLAEAERELLVPALFDLQEALISGIERLVPTATLNGPHNLRERVPGNVNVSFAPVEGESLVLRFDLEGIYVSSGSACHSAQLEGSHVLLALGADTKTAKSSVRFSLGRATTNADIQAVLDVLPRVLEKAGYFTSKASA